MSQRLGHTTRQISFFITDGIGINRCGFDARSVRNILRAAWIGD
jgi:hypothetical protein